MPNQSKTKQIGGYALDDRTAHLAALMIPGFSEWLESRAQERPQHFDCQIRCMDLLRDMELMRYPNAETDER